MAVKYLTRCLFIVHTGRDCFRQPKKIERGTDREGTSISMAGETEMSAPGPAVDRVLITNDDGIDAPGLAVLEAVAATLAREVWVVAPEHDQSGVSHSISLHGPLRVRRRDERRFGVAGTPADCVIVGLRQVMPVPPDLVLSGINRGANLGVETVFSGTVGGAMAGLLFGVPSIALSQAFSDRAAVRWDTARRLAPAVLRRLVKAEWADGACLNVNFPDVAAEHAGPLTITRQGQGLMKGVDVVTRVDPRGLDYSWLHITRGPNADAIGSETEVVAGGAIAVTPLQFERTAEQVWLRLTEEMTD
jgi:5'-nucleotidase